MPSCWLYISEIIYPDTLTCDGFAVLLAPAEEGDVFPWFTWFTLPETNISHLKLGLNAPKGNENVFQPSIFRCKLLVSGRVQGLEILLVIGWNFGKPSVAQKMEAQSQGKQLEVL